MVIAGGWLAPTNLARSAAVRDHHCPLAVAPVQHGDDIVLGAWPRHHVRRIRKLSAQAAHEIAKRFAVRVAGSIPRARGAQRGERAGRGAAGPGKMQLFHRWSGHELERLEPEPGRESPGDGACLLARRAGVRPSPASRAALPRGARGRLGPHAGCAVVRRARAALLGPQAAPAAAVLAEHWCLTEVRREIARELGGTEGRWRSAARARNTGGPRRWLLVGAVHAQPAAAMPGAVEATDGSRRHCRIPAPG